MITRHWRAVPVVALPTALIAAHGSWYGRWLIDDAGITFAYARSIATAAGPVLQPGAPPVEAFSNPAWLAVHVLGRWLGVFDHGLVFGVPDYVVFPKAVALLCCAGVFAGYYAAARAVCGHPGVVTLVAGAITAAVPSFVIWCFSGLENALLALTVVTLAVVMFHTAVSGRLLATRTAVLTGMLTAVAALTRPDGAIYAIAYPLLVLLLTRRGDLRSAGRAAAVSLTAFALPYLAFLAWRWTTFGMLVPNTAIAKVQRMPVLADAGKAVELVGYAGWVLVLVCCGCVGAVLMQPSQLRKGIAGLLIPLSLGVTAYSILVEDWMGEYRFATPVWPLAALVGTLVVAYLVPRLAITGKTGLAAALAAAVVVSSVNWWQSAQAFRHDPTTPLCHVTENTGRSFNAYADILGLQRGTVLAPDLGGTALTSRLGLIDLAGLADLRIARYWADDDMAGLRNYIFTEARPTFLQAHGFWNTKTGIISDPRLTADYELIGPRPGPSWEQRPGASWVRKDVLPAAEALIAVRDYWATVIVPAGAAQRAAPLSSCGPLTVDEPRRSPDEAR
ncbi:MAG: hypothetical protein ACRDSL_20225 [Pseudonocardiaceae bacterium]